MHVHACTHTHIICMHAWPMIEQEAEAEENAQAEKAEWERQASARERPPPPLAVGCRAELAPSAASCERQALERRRKERKLPPALPPSGAQRRRRGRQPQRPHAHKRLKARQWKCCKRISEAARPKASPATGQQRLGF